MVASAAPLWIDGEIQPVLTGLRTDVREVLVTTLLDAEPDSRHRHPLPTVWPLLTAVATSVLFISLVFTPWGAVGGTVALFLGLLGWVWPRGREHREQVRVEREA